MTKVVNKYKDKFDVYIGRGTIFGNPYTHRQIETTKAEYQVHTRDEAVAKYKEYFLRRIEHDPEFYNAVMKLKDKVLGCFCKPQSCHGDIIAAYLDFRAT